MGLYWSAVSVSRCNGQYVAVVSVFRRFIALALLTTDQICFSTLADSLIAPGSGWLNNVAQSTLVISTVIYAWYLLFMRDC